MRSAPTVCARNVRVPSLRLACSRNPCVTLLVRRTGCSCRSARFRSRPDSSGGILVFVRVRYSGTLVVTLAWCVSAVRAQPAPSAFDVGGGADGLPLSLSVEPAGSSDIAPGPPAPLLALPWTLPRPPTLPPLEPALAPPLQLRLKLPPLHGLTPYAQTTFHGAGSRLPSTELGAAFVSGPIHAGTRFGMFRDDRRLWLHNTSHLRYVAPLYDVGLETVSAYAIVEQPQVRTRMLGAAGVRVTPDAPTVRLSTSLVPDTGRAFSAISAFGSF